MIVALERVICSVTEIILAAMQKTDQKGAILSCEAREATTTPVQARDEEGLHQGSGGVDAEDGQVQETPARWAQRDPVTSPLASGFHAENVESCRLTAKCIIHAEKERTRKQTETPPKKL